MSRPTPRLNLKHSISTANIPLILPRLTALRVHSPTPDSRSNVYDFQSNHLDAASTWPSSSTRSTPLSGLGIRYTDCPDGREEEFQTAYDTPHSYTLQDLQSLRTARADSVYGTVDDHTVSPPAAFSHDVSLASAPHSPWSFSSILEAANFAANNAVSEMNASLAACLDLEGHTANLFDLEEDISSSFKILSAATGLSVAEFAAHISATAEATLKEMQADDGSCSGPPPPSAIVGRIQHDAFDDLQGELAWPPLSRRAPDLPLIDMSMRTTDTPWNDTCVGINPADILNMSPSPTLRLLDGANAHSFLDYLDDDISMVGSLPGITVDRELHAETLEEPSMRPEQEDLYQLDCYIPSGSLDNIVTPCKQTSDDDRSVFQSPSSSDYSPSLHSPSTKHRRVHKRRVTRNRSVEDSGVTFPEYERDDSIEFLPADLGTPVLDAHRGIDLEELKAKAERYRLRNNGRDYDKRWLLCFAGKLSNRGELVEEFRCYVAGCRQTNKRRDHILIHVGAHLDQRPFKCLHCPSRFLRKNECKRHELSHTGIRPYSCHLCPFPATTFVRQDLLKRHMKRTHRFDAETAGKENKDFSRPKKKARF
ncbi:hypothetical protein B0H34DRAFT_219647 [Crassisporium funariophilum]|nr:hypothetical protein B0H34DRAFT_219647 [Crassisporium funariophilum]